MFENITILSKKAPETLGDKSFSICNSLRLNKLPNDIQDYGPIVEKKLMTIVQLN
jgi:hypothetical protein